MREIMKVMKSSETTSFASSRDMHRASMGVLCAACLSVVISSLADEAVAGQPAGADVAHQALQLARRANDVIEVQNVMSRYAHYSMANQWKEIADLFTNKSGDAKLTLPTMTKDGSAAIREFLANRGDVSPPGSMGEHTLSTAVIEIAGDGQTAKGVWDSPGHETPSGDGPAYWAWVKYGVDFLREDGQWRIWHLRVYPTFRTPYERSWVETAKGASAAGGGLALWHYSGKDTPPLVPKPPVPYQTFDPRDAYL